jgi:hypothetical protein
MIHNFQHKGNFKALQELNLLTNWLSNSSGKIFKNLFHYYALGKGGFEIFI